MKKFIIKSFKILLIFTAIFILGNLSLFFYCFFTPKIKISKEQSYYLYDINNNLIFNNNKDWVSLDNINQNLINATIYTEDKSFYYHFGFDYLRIIKSCFNNIINNKLSEGASTITMQYARNLYLNYEKTWKRKFDEAILSLELETHYTKKEILEGYLNTINYGGVFGIENASKFYFRKKASELSLAEAAMIAGIPQSPNNNNPISNEQKAKKRQKIILNILLKNKKITKKEYNEAINTELKYYGNSDNTALSQINYFKDEVIQELNNIDSIPDSILETGGLRIYTTLDKEAQQDLEASLDANTPSTQLQIASMMINNKTGGVTAMIGGTDYNKTQYNRATRSKRQIGSTIKPLLYYSALENGFTASSTFTSEPTTFTLSSNKTYSPKNYNDSYANGPISMGAAISYSDNIYAVKTHLFLGEELLINTSKRLGITSDLKEIASLALGTCEISLFDITSAYATLGNLGIKNKTHYIKKIEDKNGNTIYEYKQENDYVLNSSLVYILNEMLTYTYDKSFINYNYPTIISLLPQITHKYSIKTGTTDTDYWILGYTPEYTLSVWTGYDDNKKLEDEDKAIHKNIWINTFEEYLKNTDSPWYTMPENVVGVSVDPITGKLDNDTNKSKIFYYLKGTEPNTTDSKVIEEVFNQNNNN